MNTIYRLLLCGLLFTGIATMAKEFKVDFSNREIPLPSGGSAEGMFRYENGWQFSSVGIDENNYRYAVMALPVTPEGDFAFRFKFSAAQLARWANFGIRINGAAKQVVGMTRVNSGGKQQVYGYFRIGKEVKENKTIDRPFNDGAFEMVQKGKTIHCRLITEAGTEELWTFAGDFFTPVSLSINFDCPKRSNAAVKLVECSLEGNFSMKQEAKAADHAPEGEYSKDFRAVAAARLLCSEKSRVNRDGSLSIEAGGRAMFVLDGPLNLRNPRLDWKADGALRISVIPLGTAESLEIGDTCVAPAAPGKLDINNIQERYASLRKWKFPHVSGGNLFFCTLSPTTNVTVTVDKLQLLGRPLTQAPPERPATALQVALQPAGDGYQLLQWQTPAKPAEPEVSGKLEFHEVPFLVEPIALNDQLPSVELKVGRTVGEFHLLHVSGDSRKRSPFTATYRIVYEDGSEENIFAVNRWNCGVTRNEYQPYADGDHTWWGPTGFAYAKVIYLPKKPHGVTWNALYQTRNFNPHPEKSVSRIVVTAQPGQEFILAGVTLRTPETTRYGLIEPERAVVPAGGGVPLAAMVYSAVPPPAGYSAKLELQKGAKRLAAGEIKLTASGNFAAGWSRAAIPAGEEFHGPARLFADAAVSSELGIMPPPSPGEQPFYYMMITTGQEQFDAYRRIYRLGYDAAKAHIFSWKEDPAIWDERLGSITSAGLAVALRPYHYWRLQKPVPVAFYRKNGESGTTDGKSWFDPADPETRRDIVAGYVQVAGLAAGRPGVVSLETSYGASQGIGNNQGNLLISGPALWKKFIETLKTKYSPEEFTRETGLRSYEELDLKFIYHQPSGRMLEELVRVSNAVNGSLQREVSEAVHRVAPQLRQIFHAGWRDGEGMFMGRPFGEYLRIGRDLPPVSLTDAAAERWCVSLEQWLGNRTLGLQHSDEACQNPPTFEHTKLAYMWMAAFQTREGNYCRYSVGRPAANNIAWLKPLHRMLYNADYRPDSFALALSLESSYSDAPVTGRNPFHTNQKARHGLTNTLRTLNLNPDRYMLDQFPELDAAVKAKLLIDDNNHRLPDSFADRIEKFVRDGGTYLASLDTDRFNRWKFFERFEIRCNGKEFSGPGLTVTKGFLTVAEKTVGKGKIAILVHSWPNWGWDLGNEPQEYRDFMAALLSRLGAFKPLVRSDKTAVCVTPYRTRDGEMLAYVINLRCTPEKVRIGLNAATLPQASAVLDCRTGVTAPLTKSADGYHETVTEIPPLSATVLRFRSSR